MTRSGQIELRTVQPTSFLYPSAGQMSSKLKNWTRSLCLATSKLEQKTEAKNVVRTTTKKFSILCVIVDFTARRKFFRAELQRD